MGYEWDKAKAAENLRRRHVDFRDAIPAIEDPNRLEEIDDRFDDDEQRTTVIGLSRRQVLFVVTTARARNTTRIISARKATKHEEDRCYAGDQEERRRGHRLGAARKDDGRRGAQGRQG